MSQLFHFLDLGGHKRFWAVSCSKTLVHRDEHFHHLRHTVLGFEVSSVFHEALSLEIVAKAGVRLLGTGIVGRHGLEFVEELLL